MDDYITAERRGPDSLRRFLLDLDAKEANQAESRSIGEVIELYLAVNAHPRNQGGLAPSTFQRYVSAANRHLLGKAPSKPRGEPRPPTRYAVALASVPAVRFNEPLAPRAWREQMTRDGVSKQTREHAWRVLSAALSWAAGSQTVPEIQTNGCVLANEGVVNRRRSARAGGTGYAPVGRRRGPRVPSWALSPQAVEAIREQLLLNVEHRDPLLAHRDAAIVSMQYGLGARNQEVWAMRWMSLDEGFAWVVEVLSHGQLDQWGKTEYSTQRRAAMPAILQEDLSEWRGPEAQRASGARHRLHHPRGPRQPPARSPRPTDRRLPRHQKPGRHLGSKFFTPAVTKVAEQPEFFHILGATPYALRRGGISLRLRAEDPQTVASECGTSLQMLSAHYAFAIEDLRQHGPRPVDVEWRAAREARMDKTHEEDQSADIKGGSGSGERGRKPFLAWLSASRRARRE
jgi:integrase